jgi:hypothetical protein
LRTFTSFFRDNVRFGSLADIRERIGDVRFTPKADMLSIEVRLANVTPENAQLRKTGRDAVLPR